MYKIIGANQAEYGPVTADQLRQWITEGRVNAATLAQAVGDTGWKPISTFPEFVANFASTSVPPPLMPPPLGAAVPNANGRLHALDEVNGPAIGLMVTAILGIVYTVLTIFGNLTGMTLGSLRHMRGMNFSGQNEEMFRMIQMSSGAAGIFIELFKIATGAFVFYAALKMKRLENHSLCIGASIVALLPCFSPCCCVGLFIGIWALVVLNRPEIKANFS